MNSQGHIGRVFRHCLILAVFLGAWQLVVTLLDIPRFLLPSVVAIAIAYRDNAPLLASGLLSTMYEVVASYCFSAFFGVVLASLLVKSHLFGRAVFPLLIIGQCVPILAAAPLFVVWFGFGFTPKILIAILITFFPILMGMILGLQSTDPDILMLARSMGFGPIASFFKIELPGALPMLFGGLRVAATVVVVGVVVGEFVGSSTGLGYILLRASGTINTPLLFSSLGLLIIIGFALTATVTATERWVTPWRFEAQQGD